MHRRISFWGISDLLIIPKSTYRFKSNTDRMIAFVNDRRGEEMKKISPITPRLLIISTTLSMILLQGCGSPDIDEIAEKIVKVETRHGSYTALNPKTGAYGRYQIIPSTARLYSKKLHIPFNQWKRPENQDKIFKALLADNIKRLEEEGVEVNAFTVYGCHQQGATGFTCIMRDEELPPEFYPKLRRNLPQTYRHIKNEKLREIWIDYWKKKMG